MGLKSWLRDSPESSNDPGIKSTTWLVSGSKIARCKGSSMAQKGNMSALDTMRVRLEVTKTRTYRFRHKLHNPKIFVDATLKVWYSYLKPVERHNKVRIK